MGRSRVSEVEEERQEAGRGGSVFGGGLEQTGRKALCSAGGLGVPVGRGWWPWTSGRQPVLAEVPGSWGVGGACQGPH